MAPRSHNWARLFTFHPDGIEQHLVCLANWTSPQSPERRSRASSTATHLRVAGTCEGEGLDENGQPVTGENHVDIDVDFELFTETLSHLTALPRPTNADAVDSFHIRLRNLSTGEDVYESPSNDLCT